MCVVFSRFLISPLFMIFYFSVGLPSIFDFVIMPSFILDTSCKSLTFSSLLSLLSLVFAGCWCLFLCSAYARALHALRYFCFWRCCWLGCSISLPLVMLWLRLRGSCGWYIVSLSWLPVVVLEDRHPSGGSVARGVDGDFRSSSSLLFCIVWSIVCSSFSTRCVCGLGVEGYVVVTWYQPVFCLKLIDFCVGRRSVFVWGKGYCLESYCDGLPVYSWWGRTRELAVESFLELFSFWFWFWVESFWLPGLVYVSLWILLLLS